VNPSLVVVAESQAGADGIRARIEESVSGNFRPSAAAGLTPFVDSEEALVQLLENLAEEGIERESTGRGSSGSIVGSKG
jgi:hypothetical protein